MDFFTLFLSLYLVVVVVILLFTFVGLIVCEDEIGVLVYEHMHNTYAINITIQQTMILK